jgi:DNA-binding NtrC family response regulator
MEAAGLAARCFGSAEEFLKSDLHGKPACLIVHIRMLKMSGLELPAKLKEEECNVPIILYHCSWRRQDAYSSHEMKCSRVSCKTFRSSIVNSKEFMLLRICEKLALSQSCGASSLGVFCGRS